MKEVIIPMFFSSELDVDIELIISTTDFAYLWKLEIYNEGYECGLTWLDRWNWIPGGPWVNPDRKESAEKNRLWCLGWRHGSQERLVLK